MKDQEYKKQCAALLADMQDLGKRAKALLAEIRRERELVEQNTFPASSNPLLPGAVQTCSRSSVVEPGGDAVTLKGAE